MFKLVALLLNWNLLISTVSNSKKTCTTEFGLVTFNNKIFQDSNRQSKHFDGNIWMCVQIMCCVILDDKLYLTQERTKYMYTLCTQYICKKQKSKSGRFWKLFFPQNVLLEQKIKYVCVNLFSFFDTTFSEGMWLLQSSFLLISSSVGTDF